MCARGSSPTLAQGTGELLWDAMALPGMLGQIHGEQDGHTLGGPNPQPTVPSVVLTTGRRFLTAPRTPPAHTGKSVHPVQSQS